MAMGKMRDAKPKADCRLCKDPAFLELTAPPGAFVTCPACDRKYRRVPVVSSAAERILDGLLFKSIAERKR